MNLERWDNANMMMIMKAMTYWFFKPLLSKENEGAMNDEEDVDESQQVMGIPEGIEAGQAMERGWELDDISPEPVCC